jgi:arylsulfatase
MNRKLIITALGFLSVCFVATPGTANAQTKKPNILVIFGDDIGITNISAYSDGLLGYETPNIDRIAKEGIQFLQYYGEQSCTAGRSAFLTGQHIIRNGLSKEPPIPFGIGSSITSEASMA